ncbi:MAG: LON peptidase substrate-binding domain-containing protein [Cephaloticoccus sp.]|nr:LON peptidase substrate-binding domain-containing protein [Cephaloticoccus sp.]MCF7759172.1 LON peptidase substrate-binding domain-containing protein [Cephaloticoccus sp.]
MTLPNITFFPQALLPLHIFEPRYRKMLADVLSKDRLMAVAGLDAQRVSENNAFEPPHRIITVGIIRACQKDENGTSNLLLQGLCRAEIMQIMSENPYRMIAIRALNTEPDPDANPQITRQLRLELENLLALKCNFGTKPPQQLTDFLQAVQEHDTYVDLAAFNLCDNPAVKQKLLETLGVRARFELFNRHLRAEIDNLSLWQKLQGDLPDERIPEN